MNLKSLVILDDEETVRRQLGKRVRSEGFAVHTASSVEEFTKIVRSEHVDYALVDLKVDYRSTLGGLAALSFLKRNQPWSKLIVVTGQAGETEHVVEREGADAYVYKMVPGNYIEVVIAKIQEFEGRAPRRRCFAVMPMSNSNSCTAADWTEIFEGMVKPTVENVGFECNRSSGVAGNIIKLMLDDLNRADLVVADLTDRNANVFYEVGVRHALRDSTILIAQSIDHVPFDLRAYGVVVNDWRTAIGRAQFTVEIASVVKLFSEHPARAFSPVLEYLHPERQETKSGVSSAWLRRSHGSE